MMVRENPGISKIDLMKESPDGSQHSIFMMTRELYVIGLIKYVEDPEDRSAKGRWNCIHLYLTDKGQKVAAYLEKIANELDENP